MYFYAEGDEYSMVALNYHKCFGLFLAPHARFINEYYVGSTMSC